MLSFIKICNILKTEEFLVPRQTWHPMNVQYMTTVEEVGSVFDLKSCYITFRKVFAFIITMYELNKFTKVLLATDFKIGIKEQIENLSEQKIKRYILRWLPGMLGSRHMICRNMRLVKKKGKNLMNYPIIKICRPTICKLHRLPKLFLLSSMLSFCSVAALEASKLKIITIGILDSNSVPVNITFCLPGNCSKMENLNLFIYVLREAMRVGKNNGFKYKKFIYKYKKKYKTFSQKKVEIKKNKLPVSLLILFKKYVLRSFIRSFYLRSHLFNEIDDFNVVNNAQNVKYVNLFKKLKTLWTKVSKKFKILHRFTKVKLLFKVKKISNKKKSQKRMLRFLKKYSINKYKNYRKLMKLTGKKIDSFLTKFKKDINKYLYRRFVKYIFYLIAKI